MQVVCLGDLVQLFVEPRDSPFNSLDTSHVLLELVVQTLDTSYITLEVFQNSGPLVEADAHVLPQALEPHG